MRQHARLAAACPRKNQYRGERRRDGFALRVVQRFE
jgi:hypothetical protein